MLVSTTTRMYPRYLYTEWVWRSSWVFSSEVLLVNTTPSLSQCS
uniref:Uncharacterized protein n=1 Tax=Perkinsus marinus TaxID=31276 RepID=A7YXR1_9ALVE|nr:unknown [Perkinsus marinus]